MTNSCRKIFVWFLLTNVFGNVYTGKRLNFGESEKSINEYDAVFINGKREYLKDWLSRVNENEIESNLDLKIIFTHLKCNCAYWIYTSLESIRVSNIEPCAGNVKKCTLNKKIIIDKLVSSNQNIKLAVTTLLTISDRYPILKSNESHFVTTLLSACLYIESLAFTREPGDENNNLDSQKTSEVLQNMNRMFLQIMNLIGQFAIEYCYSCRTYENDKLNANGRFNNVLKSIGLPISSESVISMDGLMLTKCMQNNDPVDEKRIDSVLCNDYVRTAMISRTDLDERISTISELFDDLRDSYDIGSVYEYMLAVYQVVLKLIYLKTVDGWTSLDIRRCEEIIEKLKSMYCPMELIDHFQLILDMKRYKEIKGFGDMARSFFTNKSNDVQNVSFDFASDDPNWVRMSLSDLTDGLLNGQFKYFWWAFNVLHREFAKKSSMTYDMSLKLFPENADSSPQLQNNFECLMLNDDSGYLSKIQSPSEGIFEDLFRRLQHDQASSVKTDLHYVYSAAQIQLKLFKNSKSKNEETFKRKLNSIRNMIDNYAIKNCKNINFLEFMYRNAFNIQNESKLCHTLKTENQCRCLLHEMKKTVSKITWSDSSKYYDELAKLTGETRIKLSGSLGTNIYFNWHGEIKSIKNIEIDILENMLNIQDLVEYQHLYSQWLLYAVYKTWLLLFEQKYQNRDNSGSKYEVAMKDLNKLFQRFYIAQSFQIYAHHYSLKVIIYSFLGHQPKYGAGTKMVELVKMGFMKQMSELLGVVKDDSINTVVNVKNLLGISKDSWKEVTNQSYPTLLPIVSYLCRFANEIQDNFQLLNLRSPSLKFTLDFMEDI